MSCSKDLNNPFHMRENLPIYRRSPVRPLRRPPPSRFWTRLSTPVRRLLTLRMLRRPVSCSTLRSWGRIPPWVSLGRSWLARLEMASSRLRSPTRGRSPRRPSSRLRPRVLVRSPRTSSRLRTSTSAPTPTLRRSRFCSLPVRPSRAF